MTVPSDGSSSAAHSIPITDSARRQCSSSLMGGSDLSACMTVPGKTWKDLPISWRSPREQRGGFVSSVSEGTAFEDPPWPAPQPLPEGLPPVMAFDYELLPPVVCSRVQDIAERMQCPPDFPAVASMITLASIIGRRCGIAPKRADDWLVVPNLWGMAIGRPGIMKSPTLAEIMKPLQVLQVSAHTHFKRAQEDYQANLMVAGEAERVAKENIRKLLKDGKNTEAAERAQAAVSSESTSLFAGATSLTIAPSKNWVRS